MSTQTPPPSGDAYDLIDDVDVPAIVPNPMSAPSAPASPKPEAGRPAETDAKAAAPAIGAFPLVTDDEPLVETAKAKTKADVSAEEKARAIEEEKARKASEAEAKRAAKEAEKRERAEAKAREKAIKAQARASGKRKPIMIPGWLGSAVVHSLIILAMMLYTTQREEEPNLTRINSALDTAVSSVEEPLKIMADPSSQRSEFLTDPTNSPVGGVSAPSATPAVAAVSTVSAKNSLPENLQVSAAAISSPLASMPAMPAIDFAGGGGIAGDVTAAVDNLDQALDQLAREILRELQRTKLTVVWLFDESNSMKDDQRAVADRFERISSELEDHTTGDQKRAAALLHTVVGFGQNVHFELEPTDDISKIKSTINNLRIDPSGIENTLQAFKASIARYGPKHINKERRLLFVLITDESGDDGAQIEDVRNLCLNNRIPVYVIGRQAMFGTDTIHIPYVDPLTKDTYWPTIRRGPETADLETLQFDGLHSRWDELPSGFGSYELARLAKDTGGIYFILPNEEELRRADKRLERVYSITTLKEYVPDYESRAEYFAKRQKSDLRRTMYNFINASKQFPFDHHLPVDHNAMTAEARQTTIEAAKRFAQLTEMEKTLKAMEKLRDRETEKRWQAAYDLMLAQTITYQVKAMEYQALLADMVQKKPVPKRKPDKDVNVDWEVHHSSKSWITAENVKELVDKKKVEAEALLRKVIATHPDTPWADFAQFELNRGFGLDYRERVLSTKYQERLKYVPKF